MKFMASVLGIWFVLAGIPYELSASSVFRFDFREAVIQDADTRAVLGSYGHEIYDFSYGQLFLRDYIGANIGFGFLTENEKAGAERLSLLWLRPFATITAQYPSFGVQPFLESGFIGYYFRSKRIGSLVQESDGWRYGPLIRGGINCSIRRLFYGKRAFSAAQELDLEDIIFSLHAGYEFMALFEDAPDYSNWYGSFGIQMIY